MTERVLSYVPIGRVRHAHGVCIRQYRLTLTCDHAIFRTCAVGEIPIEVECYLCPTLPKVDPRQRDLFSENRVVSAGITKRFMS